MNGMILDGHVVSHLRTSNCPPLMKSYVSHIEGFPNDMLHEIRTLIFKTKCATKFCNFMWNPMYPLLICLTKRMTKLFSIKISWHNMVGTILIGEKDTKRGLTKTGWTCPKNTSLIPSWPWCKNLWGNWCMECLFARKKWFDENTLSYFLLEVVSYV